MKTLKSKLPNAGPTIFSEMNEIARKYQAINLGQGFPDYQPHEDLLKAVTQAMYEGHNQYANWTGVEALRQCISSKVLSQHGYCYDENSEITVTSGATQALMSSLLALVHPGDEVIIIDPAYDLYEPAVELAGAKTVRVGLVPPTENAKDFRIDWGAIESSITDKTRMLILNFPHNPTGLILKETDLDDLSTIIEKHKLMILSDEAYEHIVFDNQNHLSPISRQSIAEHTILVSSFAKTLHATGWKIGYCCAPKRIMHEIRKVHQYTVFSVSTPMQVGIAKYLQASDVLSALSPFYQMKRDRLINGLQKTILKPLACKGTFFLLMDASALGKEKEKDLAIKLIKNTGVATIPVSAFYGDPLADTSNHQLLRLCFAKQDSTLDAAIERLQVLKE